VHIFLFLAAFAGAAHVLAPDHWVPASLLVWQRGWRPLRAGAFVALALLVHSALGLAAYWALARVVPDVRLAYLGGLDAWLTLSFGFMFMMTLLRTVRFGKVRDSLRSGPAGFWGPLRVMTLLGPAESLLAILAKGHQLGFGCLSPFAAYAGGTLVAGIAATLAGRAFCDRPLWLARGMTFAGHRRAALPVVASVLVGLGFLARLG
jgi:hypothetical protein